MADLIPFGISLLGAGAGLLQGWQQQNYNEDLTKQQWARDDNAIQRRVADLKKANLSPVLAAGSSAGNTPAIRSEVPGAGTAVESGFDAASKGISLGLQRQQLRNSEAQEKLILANADKAKAEAKYADPYYSSRASIEQNKSYVLDQTKQQLINLKTDQEWKAFYDSQKAEYERNLARWKQDWSPGGALFWYNADELAKKALQTQEINHMWKQEDYWKAMATAYATRNNYLKQAQKDNPDLNIVVNVDAQGNVTEQHSEPYKLLEDLGLNPKKK